MVVVVVVAHVSGLSGFSRKIYPVLKFSV